MLRKIDINCDLGEYYGSPMNRTDLDIMPYISSCNIACGFHSGDPVCIQDTIVNAMTHQVKIGAHPSFPDLQGFGRRDMNLSIKELEANLLYQISAINGMVEAAGGTLHHVKPHGALYNRAAKDESYATVIMESISRINPNLMVYCLSGSSMASIAQKKGIPFKSEVFIDRQYESDLTLRSRKLNGAVLDLEKAMEQFSMFVDKSSVKVSTGEVKTLQVDTVCVHSDTTDALEMAEFACNYLNKINL